MKQLRIWVFYISLLSLTYVRAQEQDTLLDELSNHVIDSLNIKKKTPLSIRFGLDLYRLALNQLNDNYKGFEALADLQITKKLFLALELGNEKKTKQSEQVNLTSNGSYYKLGFDYNMYDNWEGMNNQVYLGLRFAASSHKQILNSYTILNRTPFWPGEEIPINTGYAIGERNDLNAYWLEIVTGFKVQLLNNLYLGLSLRLNRLISDKIPENFDNVFIPGFNKKTDENKFGAGFNYTLSYTLPFSFKKK